MGYRDCSITNNRVTLEAMKGEVEMILSDEEIKVDDWGTYTVFKQSHLEANARIRELEAKLLEIGTALGMADNLGTVIEYGAIHAKDLSDDLSRVNQRKMELWVKIRELIEAVEERDRVEKLEEPDYFPDPEKRYIFQDTKYQVWERYQAALTTAKEG